MAEKDNKDLADKKIQYVLIGLAITTFVLGLASVVYKAIDEKTLMFLGSSAVILLLKNVKTFNIGDNFKVEMKDEAVKNMAEIGIGGKIDSDSHSKLNIELDESIEKNKAVIHPDDPNKGKFRGVSVDNDRGRMFIASVGQSALHKDWFNIKLEVRSLNVNKNLLQGKVKFILHPTFRKDVVEVTAIDGIAKLELTAWGAFTALAIADNGQTKLELDLSEIPNAPASFRAR